MYPNKQKLIIFDADGTIIDAFSAIEQTFALHGMAIGDLDSFQQRHKFFKYLGGLKEFPTNIKKQIGKKSRQQILTSLTEVYREEARLYDGLAQLIKDLIAHKQIRLGLVTRNVSFEPKITMEKLFARHDIDLAALDFFAHVPVHGSKADAFRQARQQWEINPARAYTCGDEHKDYAAALRAGMHPFVVSYGFENFKRLHKKFEIPEELIARTPSELCLRIRHTLDLSIEES
ncbi:HAD family hydrolase [Undibacterium fentianense]|uniref:phosphoglycolate phosphatase n=1 Tax=Undibacterium fentianense TaxID=2828728 RepID=A0A941E4X5_9BURK|nr:HAD hydrolase-like protein [Undibacterium fentianense]MBR7800684.1 HAD family hydrolase [Undibacterium fentianense]